MIVFPSESGDKGRQECREVLLVSQIAGEFLQGSVQSNAGDTSCMYTVELQRYVLHYEVCGIVVVTYYVITEGKGDLTHKLCVKMITEG